MDLLANVQGENEFAVLLTFFAPCLSYFSSKWCPPIEKIVIEAKLLLESRGAEPLPKGVTATCNCEADDDSSLTSTPLIAR